MTSPFTNLMTVSVTEPHILRRRAPSPKTTMTSSITSWTPRPWRWITRWRAAGRASRPTFSRCWTARLVGAGLTCSPSLLGHLCRSCVWGAGVQLRCEGQGVDPLWLSPPFCWALLGCMVGRHLLSTFALLARETGGPGLGCWGCWEAHCGAASSSTTTAGCWPELARLCAGLQGWSGQGWSGSPAPRAPGQAASLKYFPLHRAAGVERFSNAPDEDRLAELEALRDFLKVI